MLKDNRFDPDDRYSLVWDDDIQSGYVFDHQLNVRVETKDALELAVIEMNIFIGKMCNEPQTILPRDP